MASYTSRPGRLAGRVCVITGTARGVGRAAVRLFAQEGAVVIGVDLDAAGNQQTRELVESDGHTSHLFDGDVNDAGLLTEVVDHCARHGRVDVLFNNAVLVVEDTVDVIDLDAWDRVMETNVKAPLRYTQALTPLLAASERGSIINHSSIDGVLVNPHVASYSISKAALGGLTRATAASLADRGIRANAIASGNATRSSEPDENSSTGFAEKLLESESVSWARMFTQLAWNTPGQRVGTVEELARVALFLASDDSSFVNGVSLLVDGGRGSLTPGTGLVPGP